jgi:FixJ family two-component response regulator
MVWEAPVSNLLPRTLERFPDRRSGDMAAATLTVNDDNSVCEATIDLLRAMGFVARGSHSAEDFLESNHLGRTSCLIADMRTPGMSGLDLHAHLVRSGKDIRTSLTTAFPNDRIARATGRRRLLVKPFKDADLLGCIQSGIESHRVGTQ